MAKNYIQKGEVLQYTPSGAVVAGALVIIGTLAAVALSDIAASTTGTVQITGVFRLAKATGAISQGVKVYWDATNSNVTTTASGNTLIGVAAKAETSGATTVDVLINVAN